MSTFWKYLFFVCLAMGMTFPAAAQKAPSDEDIDSEDRDPTLLVEGQQGNEPTEHLVEVARGSYVQTDPVVFGFSGLIAGTPGYPSFGIGLSTGHGMRIHVGGDLKTTDKFGLSAQATAWQVVNRKSITPSPTYLHQGPTRSYLLEAAIRPTAILGSANRFNLYLRVGGGVCFFEGDRSDLSAESMAIYSSFTYGLNPKPFGSVGFGLEYYTRLSHFSFNFFEIDVLYILNVDLAYAFNFAGFKYTF